MREYGRAEEAHQRGQSGNNNWAGFRTPGRTNFFLLWEKHVVGLPPQDEVKTLDKYVTIINLLLAAGARNPRNDWSKVYCQKCDLTPILDLSGANFEDSFLSGANFAHVKLTKANFQNADLGDTNFFAADLTDADLSWTNDFSPHNAVANASRDRPFTTFPYLDCATLEGTNLSHVPLMFVQRDFYGANDEAFSTLSIPNIAHAKVNDKTRLDGIGVRIEYTFGGMYYDHLEEDEKRKFEQAFENGFLFSWRSGIADFSPSTVYPRTEISFKGDDHNTLGFIRRRELFWIREVKAVSDWAKPLFEKALSHQFWPSLPATTRLLAHLQDSKPFFNDTNKSTEVIEDAYCSNKEPSGELTVHVYGR